MSSTLTDPETPAPRPHLTIKPSTRWSALNLGEVWQFRDLLMTLATRDVKLRYRQTALGALWVVLQPLLAAGITSFVFNRVAKLPTGGIPPFLFAFAGFLMWNAFSATLTKASGSLVGNTQLVSKVYFPRLILPLSTIFSSLIDFGVSLVMLAILMAAYGVHPHVGLLLLPVWLLLILMLSIGFGLVMAALTVSYRDVAFILPVIIQFLWYACPIAYSSDAVTRGTAHVPHLLQHIYFLNPLVSYFDAAHWSLLGTGTLHWASIGYSTLFTVAVFVGGAFLFKKMERRFADVI